MYLLFFQHQLYQFTTLVGSDNGFRLRYKLYLWLLDFSRCQHPHLLEIYSWRLCNQSNPVCPPTFADKHLWRHGGILTLIIINYRSDLLLDSNVRDVCYCSRFVGNSWKLFGCGPTCGINCKFRHLICWNSTWVLKRVRLLGKCVGCDDFVLGKKTNCIG